MDPQTFDRIGRRLEVEGPLAAFDQLVAALEEQGNYHAVFDALTMRARYELGLPLIHRASGADLPDETRIPYEDKVIAACRTVGQLFLAKGDIPGAFQYFRMLGELEPVRRAIEAFEPDSVDQERVDQLVEIALSHGVHPAKGLAIVLDRFGTCQAITACEGLLAQGVKKSDHEACVKLLVRRLHEELIDRLLAEIGEREKGSAPAGRSVPLLIKDRDWLFENENYHIDTSHLSAVVRMARLLPKCEETYLAMQLCEYGTRLSDRYKYPEPPPFEEVYADSMVYFRTITGREVDKGLEHFEQKARKANPDDSETYPIEVYINLLLAAGREEEAVAYAGRKLNRPAAGGPLAMVNDLCQQAGRFEEMARLARKRNDLLSYTAGLIQHRAALAAQASAATP